VRLLRLVIFDISKDKSGCVGPWEVRTSCNISKLVLVVTTRIRLLAELVLQ